MADMVSPGPATRGVSNSSVALERLRALLDAEGDRAEWQLPTERDLATRIGVGRRAVRRALEVLEAEGRIWRHQGKGTFAGQRPPVQPHLIASLADRTSPLEVMEARLQIEPALARLAALKASPDSVEALRRIEHKTAASTDSDSHELWDSAFHRHIAEMAGNGLLLALFDCIDRIRQSPSWRRLREAARNRTRLRTYTSQHGDILAAIARHDAAGAEAAMQRHLLALQANLQAAMLGAPAPADPRAAPSSPSTMAEVADGPGL